MLHEKSFTILPKSPDILPKSFKILPKSESEKNHITRKSIEEQYIKEAHQSFVVLGKSNISEVDTIEDILDDTSTSSKDTIRLSEDESKDIYQEIRRPYRLLPLKKPLGDSSERKGRWFTQNNWAHQLPQRQKV